MPPREIDRCNHVKQKEYVPNIMRQKLDHTWNLQDYLDDKDWYEMGIDTKKKENPGVQARQVCSENSQAVDFF